MSDQPTEKHERWCESCTFAQSKGEPYGEVFCSTEWCAQNDRNRFKSVHQPSAVQAPERIYMLPKNVDGSLWPKKVWPERLPCEAVQYVHIDAYEAQAVRIAELEDALRRAENIIAGDGYLPDTYIRRQISAALKPKEGK